MMDRSMSVSAASRSTHSRTPKRNNSAASLPVNTTPSPPPRPPPPRGGSTLTHPSSRSPQDSPRAARHVTPPSLPPKQKAHAQIASGSSVRTVLSLDGDNASAMPALDLPPPLIPIPAKVAPTPPKAESPQHQVQPEESDQPALEALHIPVSPSPPKIPAKSVLGVRPAIPPRNLDRGRASLTPPPLPQRTSSQASPSGVQQEDSAIKSISQVTSRDQTNAVGDNNSECCVCWERPPDCALYTCGHVCMCYSCALNIKHSKDPLCPVCRHDIKDVIKIFKS